jgi:predicted ABC-type sugar transport system permease subunit
MRMVRQPICVLGSLNIDLTVTLERFHQPGETVSALGFSTFTGGKGGMLQTIIGILIYMELLNFLTIIGVDANYKKAIQGIIIIIAVALTLTRTRKTIAK